MSEGDGQMNQDKRFSTDWRNDTRDKVATVSVLPAIHYIVIAGVIVSSDKSITGVRDTSDYNFFSDFSAKYL